MSEAREGLRRVEGHGWRGWECVKCGENSGDSWEQCRGACPVPGSPHYKPGATKADEPQEIDA